MKGDFMMVRRQGDWLTARVGDELVMMSAQTGDYVGLTEVGARLEADRDAAGAECPVQQIGGV
jgi:hypothetical protein